MLRFGDPRVRRVNRVARLQPPVFVGGVVVDARPTSVGHDTGEHGATKPERFIARTNQHSLHAEQHLHCLHHHTAGKSQRTIRKP